MPGNDLPDAQIDGVIEALFELRESRQPPPAPGPVQVSPPDRLLDAEIQLMGGNPDEAMRLIIAEHRSQRGLPREIEPWLPRVVGTTIIFNNESYSVRPYFAAWIEELLVAYTEKRFVPAKRLNEVFERGNIKRDFDKQVAKIPGLSEIIWAEPGHGGGRIFRRPKDLGCGASPED